MSRDRDRRAARVGAAPASPTPAPIAPSRVFEDGALPDACMHGALFPNCAFAGCPHFRADGPRDEKWAFHPDATPQDIEEAMRISKATHARAAGSASPIHLVVHKVMYDRQTKEAAEAAEAAAVPIASPEEPQPPVAAPTSPSAPPAPTMTATIGSDGAVIALKSE